MKIERTRTPEKRRERSPVKPKLERRIDRSPEGSSRRREDDRRKSPRRDRSRDRAKESRSRDHREPPRKENRERSREKSHKSDSRNGRDKSRDRSDSRKERDRPANGTSRDRDRKRSDDRDRSRDSRRSRDRSPNRSMEIAKFDDRNGGGGPRGGKTNGNDWSVATEISTEPVRLAEDFADPDREPLETAYGVQFPLDFFRLYELMCKLSPVNTFVNRQGDVFLTSILYFSSTIR